MYRDLDLLFLSNNSHKHYKNENTKPFHLLEKHKNSNRYLHDGHHLQRNPNTQEKDPDDSSERPKREKHKSLSRVQNQIVFFLALFVFILELDWRRRV